MNNLRGRFRASDVIALTLILACAVMAVAVGFLVSCDPRILIPPAPPTRAPTLTPTLQSPDTVTATWTPTASPTFTATVTHTIAPTQTATLSPTLTFTASPTSNGATPTNTPINTVTPGRNNLPTLPTSGQAGAPMLPLEIFIGLGLFALGLFLLGLELWIGGNEEI